MPISLIIIAHIGGVLFIISMLSSIAVNVKKYQSPTPLTFLELYKGFGSVIDAFTPKILDILEESNPEIKQEIQEIKKIVVNQRLMLQDKIKSFIEDKDKDI